MAIPALVLVEVAAMPRVSDEQIEEAADKMIAGQPLTRAERRLLDSPQADFAMGQVRAYLSGERETNND